MCDHCGCRSLTPVARLMDEHDHLRDLSERIRRHLARGDDAAARGDFAELLDVLAPHVAEEEGALFPRLRAGADLAGHVAALESEHADLFDAVDDLDDTSPDEWPLGVVAVLRDLDEHMYKEDFGLFPAALATLDGPDWDAIEESGVRSLQQAPAGAGRRPG